MKRIESHITNIGFVVMNEEQTVKNGKGHPVKTRQSNQGVELNCAVVNGKSAGVGLRTINGKQKSAQITLDQSAIFDLHAAITEILGKVAE